MVRYADPPFLLRDAIEDPSAAVELLVRNAPYRPIGGWYHPGEDLDAPIKAMWFQKDWVHAGLVVPGSEVFLRSPRYLEAASRFYDARKIVPGWTARAVGVECSASP
ncbi:MAG: hypothetical protein R3F35_02235 [Myxococcota bacterium]